MDQLGMKFSSSLYATQFVKGRGSDSLARTLRADPQLVCLLSEKELVSRSRRNSYFSRMTIFSESENFMWDKPIRSQLPNPSDAEINEKYKVGENRIVTESNREKLPNFVKALEKPDYMKVRPFYQRRERWDVERQSQLVESFIMNIPVPPLFLYENAFNRYEVMDGQQRITALKSFYAGEFTLKGLKVWKELNGRTYSTLPSQIRDGLDRRSISYVIVLKESTIEEEDAAFLRQTVFERLNTGGIRLEHQEIRNCLYQGPFNNLLIELSKEDRFRKAFRLPRYTADEETQPSAAIKKVPMYKKMRDTEIILRFFALRHVEHYVNGMQGFLSLYMSRAQSFSKDDINTLRTLFNETLDLALDIYGDEAFCAFNPNTQEWQSTPQKAYYDAVMISLSRLLDFKSKIISSKAQIISATKRLFIESEEGTFTGRGNTKNDIKERIDTYYRMIAAFAA